MINVLQKDKSSMPQLVSKIIQYRCMLNNTAFSKGVFNLDEPVYYQYSVGEPLPGLRHKNSKHNIDETQVERIPLFNKNNHTIITDCIGQYGLLHVKLETDKYLKEIIVEPDGVSVDILAGSDQMLVYEFYNSTKIDTIIIRATLADDKDDICSKIKNHKDDLEFRQYYLRQALKRPGVTPIDKPKVEYPEWLTVDELAEYLGLSKSTVYKKTSSKEYKSYPKRGKRKYKKADFD